MTIEQRQITPEYAQGLVDRLVDGKISEHTIAGYEMLMAVVNSLIVAADQSVAKNYVEIHMVGVPAPFDRVTVTLHRPGGKTADELKREAVDLARRAIDMLGDTDLDETPEVAILRAELRNLPPGGVSP